MGELAYHQRSRCGRLTPMGATPPAWGQQKLIFNSFTEESSRNVIEAIRTESGRGG